MKDTFRKAEEEKVNRVNNTKQAVGLTLRVPTIKKVETTTNQEVIDKAVADIRQYLADIPDHMTGLVSRIRKIQGASPEERAIRSSELKALEDEVLAHLNSEEELLRDAAVRAYAEAMVSTLPPDKRLVAEAIKGNSRLPGLLELKILERTSTEAKNAVTVKVYGEPYKVNGKRDFAMQLSKNLSAGAAHAAKAAHEYYHGQINSLKELATISVTELLARKPGLFFLTVSDKKEDEKFFPGGALLAESDGMSIKIAQVVGHFHRVLEEIRDVAAFVPISSLNSARLELSKRLSEDAFRRMRILHAVLRRGIAEAQKETG